MHVRERRPHTSTPHSKTHTRTRTHTRCSRYFAAIFLLMFLKLFSKESHHLGEVRFNFGVILVLEPCLRVLAHFLDGLGEFGVVDGACQLLVLVDFFEQVLVWLHPLGHLLLMNAQRLHAVQYALLLASRTHHLGTVLGRLGGLGLREKAALDCAVNQLHILTLHLQLLAIFQLHHIAANLAVKALDDARLPVVLRGLRQPHDFDARV
mmetsp:Transcript_30347/g.44320  ORF Transcript_30347/g.44320 Transcript_30347/m.44320 type:complete len:208 (-) Transcript_30347:74-697(-)